MMYHAFMMDNLELEDRRPNPAIANIPSTPAFYAGENSGGKYGARQEPPSTTTQCLWCGRAYTPRMTGGSPQRFCSTGHRQAFWVAARRWTMRAVEAGLINVDCLKVP